MKMLIIIYFFRLSRLKYCHHITSLHRLGNQVWIGYNIDVPFVSNVMGWEEVHVFHYHRFAVNPVVLKLEVLANLCASSPRHLSVSHNALHGI